MEKVAFEQREGEDEGGSHGVSVGERISGRGNRSRHPPTGRSTAQVLRDGRETQVVGTGVQREGQREMRPENEGSEVAARPGLM